MSQKIDYQEDIDRPIAIFETSLGHFEAELYAKECPQTVWNFINLAEGVYSLQIFDTDIRQDNIALDGLNSREINLIVPESGPEPTEKRNFYSPDATSKL